MSFVDSPFGGCAGGLTSRVSCCLAARDRTLAGPECLARLRCGSAVEQWRCVALAGLKEVFARCLGQCRDCGGAGISRAEDVREARDGAQGRASPVSLARNRVLSQQASHGHRFYRFGSGTGEQPRAGAEPGCAHATLSARLPPHPLKLPTPERLKNHPPEQIKDSINKCTSACCPDARSCKTRAAKRTCRLRLESQHEHASILPDCPPDLILGPECV
jgi:hypothetical protein